MSVSTIFSGSAEEARCERVMAEFLALDKGEALPMRLSLHIIGCSRCRTEVRRLSLAERLAARPLKECDARAGKPVSMTQWVVAGALMTLLLVIFGIASSNRGTELQLGLYIVYGLALCGYCALFVAKNLDFFIKKIGGGTRPTATA